jgi:hypothetical protein
MLRSVKPAPQAGILVGSQSIDWYRGRQFVSKAYENCYHGAFQLFKDNGYDAEPFLDYQLTADLLTKYRLVYVPNAPCLSDAQCTALARYVENGGTLIATHLTSTADEFGRARKDFGLGSLFGAKLRSPEPIEIPDLYLTPLPKGEMLPQDPQVVLFDFLPGSEVLAETRDLGHRRTLGPAIIRRRHGMGQVIYIGSSLEAVYEETLMEPLRRWFGTMVSPFLASTRPYEVEFHPGLMPHFVSSPNALLLHLLADTGNKWKKYHAREHFLPLSDVKTRIRLPQGRQQKSVGLLRAGTWAQHAVRDGWIEVTVPRVPIHEAVYVELA